MAEINGWIADRPQPEWTLALRVAASIIFGRALSWLAGTYVGFFDIVCLMGAIVSGSRIGGRVHSGGARPIDFDETCLASIRVAFSYPKRYLPWLTFYVAALVVIERQSVLTALLICLTPVAFIAACVPWLFIVLTSIQVCVAIPNGWGPVFGVPLVAAYILAMPLTLAVATTWANPDGWSVWTKGAYLLVLYVCCSGAPIVVNRLLYRHSRLDITR